MGNIEERAAKVLNAIKYNKSSDICVDSVQLAKFFGFEVQEKDSLLATEDGRITISGDETEKCIAVNNTRSFEFKRFIIAHELAYYLLHYMGNGTSFKHRKKGGRSVEENDADYFAAALLMPQESFKWIYRRYRDEGLSENRIYLKLAAIYKVPLESVLIRIGEIDSLHN